MRLMELTRPRVGLFVTCLVDLFRPSVGFATVKLLEEAGCIVEVPEIRPEALRLRTTRPKCTRRDRPTRTATGSPAMIFPMRG